MQCEIYCKSRSRGLNTVFRYAPDLLGRRSLPYLNRIGPRFAKICLAEQYQMVPATSLTYSNTTYLPRPIRLLISCASIPGFNRLM